MESLARSQGGTLRSQPGGDIESTLRGDAGGEIGGTLRSVKSVGSMRSVSLQPGEGKGPLRKISDTKKGLTKDQIIDIFTQGDVAL